MEAVRMRKTLAISPACSLDLCLPNANVHLTVLDIGSLKAQADRILPALTKADLDKAGRYQRETDRLRSLGAAYLLRQAAAGQEIRCNSFGKPFVQGRHLNVSHSGDFVMLAEAEREVGVDVEKVFPESEIQVDEELEQAALTDQERPWAKGSAFRFFVLWTRKESLVKCEGTGFEMEPKEIEVLPRSNCPCPEWHGEKNLPSEAVRHKGKAYWLTSFLLEGHVISLALAEAKT